MALVHDDVIVLFSHMSLALAFYFSLMHAKARLGGQKCS